MAAPAFRDIVALFDADPRIGGTYFRLVEAGFQPTPWNFSEPLLAIPLEIACWSAERKFTQKNPAWRISGQAREVFAGQNITSGGSRETLENDWQVIPTGSSPDIDVTTVTPVANMPSTSRN